jgi:hypothetical protein
MANWRSMDQKTRVPEIALGALLAVGIFAIGFLAAASFGLHHDGDGPSAAGAGATHAFWDKAADDPVAYFTLWLVGFTGVLALSTIGLWLVTWRSGVRQSKETRDAIQVARHANEIGRSGIIAEQRAWVSVGDLKIDKDILFREHGANISISVMIKNIGKTPALGVHTAMEMICGYGEEPDAVKRLSEEAKSLDPLHRARTLLPGDSYRRKWGFHIDWPSGGVGHVFPVIIGCTTYQISPDNSIHQTAFVFRLFECPTGEPSEFVDAINPEKPLTKASVGWDGGSGGFAD